MRSRKIWNGISGSPSRCAYCWKKNASMMTAPAAMTSGIVTGPHFEKSIRSAGIGMLGAGDAGFGCAASFCNRCT